MIPARVGLETSVDEVVNVLNQATGQLVCPGTESENSESSFSEIKKTSATKRCLELDVLTKMQNQRAGKPLSSHRSSAPVSARQRA
mmetsp:Transcript_170634/g.547344  ORF Transcript_170634/g.547344 Transcript_170634/m.547344 type:complete len:86 (+) Transcript_170634:372-629(+)